MAEAFTVGDIEILVATMHRDNFSFLGQMFPYTPFYNYKILVINQTTPDKELISTYPSVRVINSFEKGLSKSRNLALQNAIGTVCVITDDDVIFTDGFEVAVLQSFNKNADAALIAFRVKNDAGKPYRKYPAERKTQTTVIDRLLILSVEMVVNSRIVNKLNIRFDEQFGLGAAFGMGEEAIFVKDLYTAGGKIALEPVTIVCHPHQDTHSRVSIAEKYYVQGAFFSRLFGNMWLAWLFSKLAHELKHKKIRLSYCASALRAAYKGRKAFKKNE